jgi:hypothetical protein
MNDEKAAEGIDHLQAAALEMIEAARAFLDVVEEVVSDREKVAGVASTISSVATAAARAASSEAENARKGSGDDHVERITLS